MIALRRELLVSNKTGIAFLVLLMLGFGNCDEGETPVDEQEEEEETSPYLWVRQIPPGIYYTSPALSADENAIYLGTSKGGLSTEVPLNNVFVSLSTSNGNPLWSLELGSSQVRSSPAVASDHSIYFTVQKRDASTGLIAGNELWRVSAQGKVLWKFNINSLNHTSQVGQSSPAIGLDGTIFVGGDKLYAINPDGTERWSYGPPLTTASKELLTNSPVIAMDGTVYFAFHNVPLTAFEPETGDIKWSRNLGPFNDHCFSSPAIGEDGRIYIATNSGVLHAVAPSGQVEWTFEIGSIGYTGVFRCSPSIDEDGTIYIGLNNGSPSSAFLAINPTGSLKWIFEPSDLLAGIPTSHMDIYSSPAIGEDGIIYFGEELGRVYGLRSSDGSQALMVDTNSGITWPSPVLDTKGVLYIADLSGSVYALQTASPGLKQQAQWPKFRFNNQNSGRVPGP